VSRNMSRSMVVLLSVYLCSTGNLRISSTA